MDIERTVVVSLDHSEFNRFEFNTIQHEGQSEDDFIAEMIDFVLSNIQIDIV